ncbi:hybrid sensor histidine kinase/response regulator transcription factor [Dyadobacter pollutisoli]|uniref:histidine kinase n=1 Tax=Dyadobacter pollutisoli TaxID=2910158 RepID=A0A9E8NF67_9BACT|nr:two-component regulator propeller domain-containing protein [Dyadobacter pollutisoli]WAC13014.1 response regulator [Dyadobacter pollutisoli]
MGNGDKISGVKQRLVGVLLLLVLFTADAPLSAQDKSPKFRFEHITVDDGLAHSDAMDVVQGSRGFIWIATNNGVDRFDGYDLKHYQLPLSDPTGVSSNRVQVLFVDLNGTLWVGTEHAGIYYYNHSNDQFQRPVFKMRHGLVGQERDRLSRGSVRSMAMDQRRRLWIATSNHGVFCLTPDANAVISSVNSVALGSPYGAASVLVTEARQIWIGTLQHGLWRVDSDAKAENGTYRASKNNTILETEIHVMRRGANGMIWIASDNFVYRLSPGPGKATYKVEKLPEFFYEMQCLYPDSFGRLWIGTNFGLHLIENPETYLQNPHSQRVHHYAPQDSDPSSINSGRIHQIMEDTFGNLWLAASAGGVNRIRLQSKGFHHLSREVSGKPTLTNNFVNAVTRDDARNRVWIGTRNGYSVYDEGSGSYHNFLSVSPSGNATGNDVSAFCLVGDYMWIGTRYKGLYMTEASHLERPVLLAELTGLSPWNYLSIESIVADGKGRVWVGTFGAGMSLFTNEGKYIRTYNRSNSPLPTDDISFLLVDPSQDVIWVSTRDQGVLKMQEKNGVLRLLRQFKHEPGNETSLKVNFAWPLLGDKEGNIWIGTIGGGLHKLYTSNGKEKIARFQHLVADNDIESMLADSQGNLWLAGAGLKRFSPKTGEVVHYDVSDGLQSNSFKVGSAFKSASGTMYFGGTNGLTWFKPEEIRPNPLPPLVRITGFRVLNKNPDETYGQAASSMVTRSFSEAEGVTINAGENDFSFEFVGLNYVNPQKQSYAVMMEGYSKSWIQLPDGQRSASFANLPAGDYVFRVKANNGEGVWSVTPASVHVKVLPPWWQTWWAYLAYLILFAALLFLYRKLTTSRLKLENKLALEKLKSDNEREMAEMKATFFTGVSHEFRTPLTLILGPMEEFVHTLSGSEAMREKVMMMHKQTRKLLNLVNQLLSFRKVESGTMQLSAARQDIVVLIKEIFSIFKIKADELDLRYQLDIPPGEVPVYFDPEKLEVIITNLLSNAFKYCKPGGDVTLTARIIGSPQSDAKWENNTMVDHYVEISVSDTGKGIREDERERIFDPYFQASNATSGITGSGIGLALVKEFVNRHSGHILVKSEIGVGSTFVVQLPFGKEHLQEHELADDISLPLLAETQTGAVAQVSRPKVPKKGAAKILIVEDNTDLRRYLSSLFQDLYEVFLSPDGSDGWAKATEILPDLIISDVNMPEMNGLDLSKKIKQNLKTTHIPVILLTARAAAVQELEGLETGADDYIVKPFNEDILKAKINTLLHNRGRLQEYYQRQILLQPTEILIPDEDKIFLETAMQIVEANLTDSDFNVQSLVTSMHMSQSVFYRRIKSITGQTVIEFIKDVRLKRAAQLLTNQHARVSEVAFMVGIEDPKNFRVSFQKRYGMSPSQYASAQREPREEASASDG